MGIPLSGAAAAAPTDTARERALSGRRLFWTLVAAAFLAQLIQLVPLFVRSRSALEGLTTIAYSFSLNLVPALSGAWWVRRCASRRRAHPAWSWPWFGGYVASAVGYGVCFFASALLLRLVVLGVEPLRLSIAAPVFWLSGFYSLPMWFVLVELMAAIGAMFDEGQAREAQAQRALRQRERAETMRLATELRMLRTFIQPHFLFNALNSIASLLETAPAQARRAIVTTADLLRAATAGRPTEDDRWTLREELVVVRAYLELEGLRMQGRLRVVEQVPPELESTEIPRFAVQTLVENAVRHGLFPKPAGGTVQLSAARRNGEVTFEVRDDGVGCVDTDLTDVEGMGLRSVRERLRAAFGETANLHVETGPNGGFSVRLQWAEVDE
jgi:hypothetical protein